MLGEPTVARIGAGRHGIVPAALARAEGVSDADRKMLRRRGVLVRVGRGVDRLRDHPFDFSSRCQAVLDLGGPSAALGIRTAARLQGCWAYRDCDIVEALIPRNGDHRLPFGRLRESTWLPEQHITVVDGFRVTTLARTFFDLCGDPDPHLRRRGGHPYHEVLMRRVYDDCLARRGLTFHLEASVLVVLAKRGRPGTRLVRAILLSTGELYIPTQSELESIFVELLDVYGIEQPRRQVALSDERGFIGVVDFLWDGARHIVETDGAQHDGPSAKAHDAERDARLAALGYTVARYGYGDLIGRPAAVAAELSAVVADSAPQLPTV